MILLKIFSLFYIFGGLKFFDRYVQIVEICIDRSSVVCYRIEFVS